MSKGSSDLEEDKKSESGSGRSSKSSDSGDNSHDEEDSDSSSGTSGSGSDQSDAEEENKGEEEKEEENKSDDNVEEDEDENKSRSSRSRSHSGSDSGQSRSGSESRSGSRSSSGSSHSGSQLSDSDSRKRKHKSKKEKLWEDNPELYGIRRSNRPRVDPKPPKLESQVGHKRKFSKKHGAGKVKRRKFSTGDDSSDEENSRNVRQRNAAVSYKEAESEDEGDLASDNGESDDTQDRELEPEEHVETIERVMESRMGKKGATGSSTTIYAVAEKGNPNLTIPVDTEVEKQFFIKWMGWSYLHNTWESLETLQEMKVKGLKKLDNFCKKDDEHSRWKSRASPEDVEYGECQLELQQELVKSYVYAERVIAEKSNSEGVKEFYVKWDNLPYAEATWESADLIKKRNPEVIKDFKRRENSNRTPVSSHKYLRSRPKFVQVKSQPDYLKGETLDLILRDYQMDGLNWLVHSWCKENSVILADEMGLGKTIQTICFLSYLFETYSLYGPYLLVVPLSTMAAWQKEFSQWAPHINVVTYLGDIPSRGIIQEYEWCFTGTRKLKFNAILTTYEIVLKDSAFLSEVHWAAMMVDEAHRLKNQDSLLYKALVDFDSNHRLLITGTPLQNSLKELWALLHFIMPHKFDDWESFEQEHDQSATKGYTKLHKQLEPFILRRVKKDVEKSLPSKVEQILRVEMTTLQKQYYKWILTKNYSALRKGVKGSVTSFINVVMELKKCCNHATLIKPFETAVADSLSQLIKGSGKLMLLDKLLVRLKDTGHRVLIFSQMVMMLDIIAEYLQLRRFSFQRLDGSVKGDMRKQALDHFNADGSNDFCFLLSTRAGGLGINLATADTVIIFDSDWNPQNDLQAQARAHRIGQKNQVMIYRLVTKNSVEEDIVERAKRKMVLDHLVIQRMDTTGRTVLEKGSKSSTPFNKDELNAILKFGAEELFKEDENEGEDNCDIDEILRRAETHEESARPGDELLSAFKVASFSVNEEEELPEPARFDPYGQDPPSQQDNKDWEQIIPEDIRKQIDDEQKEKEMAELFLPPRSSRNAAVTDAKGQPLGNEALNRKAKNRKRKRGADKESEDEESDSESGSPSPKKRGRPKHGKGKGKDFLKFTDPEVKKFLKSLKKFPVPLLRIDKIAEDCGMQDKSLADLKKLAELLLSGCEEAIAEQKANPQPIIKEESLPPPAEGDPVKKRPNKPREKGPIFRVCGSAINARTMSIAIEELQVLGQIVPVEESARKNWKIDLKVKTTGFDVEWGQDEDTRLLLGIWEFGNGAYDKIIEADPILKEKVFLEGEKKPLLKDIRTRADYLIRSLKKLKLTLKPKPVKPAKKKREPKAKKLTEAVSGDPSTAAAENGTGKGKKAKGAKKVSKKKEKGPMHFAAQTEPTSIAVLGNLDPLIFNECKEKMRPVKKSLKTLDNPDKNLSETDQIQQTKSCLIEIGQRIETCLKDYSDSEEIKKWKSYLWYFVSKFTEFDAKKLHRVYKKATKGDKDHKSSKHKDKKQKRDRKDKDKKHKKEKRQDRREKDEPGFQDNSNSSVGDYSRDGKSYKQPREDRMRDPRSRDRPSRHENDRAQPTNFEQPGFIPGPPGSSFNTSPRKYANGPYPPHDPYQNNSYRDRERDSGRAHVSTKDPRSTGTDPRRIHKSQQHQNYDRDRDRGGSGRSSWGGGSHQQDSNRWGPGGGGGGGGNYGGPRREGGSNDSPYYNNRPVFPKN